MLTFRILAALVAVLASSCTADSDRTTTVAPTTTTIELPATTAPTVSSGSVIVDDELLFSVALRLWFEDEDNSPLDRFMEGYANQTEAESDLVALGARMCEIVEDAKAESADARVTVAYIVSLMSSDRDVFDLQYTVQVLAVDYLCPDVKEWYDEGAKRYVTEDD